MSWYEPTPSVSLALIAAAGASSQTAVVDVGGGASRLVDALLDLRFRDLTVVDLSIAALDDARRRLQARAEKVTWIAADVTRWQPERRYDLWHDRAAFHFLTAAADREAYVARLASALRPGGQAIIATFAADGPERCSGLPVVRYDAAQLADALGAQFRLVEARRDDHSTPWGVVQRFQFCRFERLSLL